MNPSFDVVFGVRLVIGRRVYIVYIPFTDYLAIRSKAEHKSRGTCAAAVFLMFEKPTDTAMSRHPLSTKDCKFVEVAFSIASTLQWNHGNLCCNWLWNLQYVGVVYSRVRNSWLTDG